MPTRKEEERKSSKAPDFRIKKEKMKIKSRQCRPAAIKSKKKKNENYNKYSGAILNCLVFLFQSNHRQSKNH